jgi:hypothetical protein
MPEAGSGSGGKPLPRRLADEDVLFDAEIGIKSRSKFWPE